MGWYRILVSPTIPYYSIGLAILVLSRSRIV